MKILIILVSICIFMPFPLPLTIGEELQIKRLKKYSALKNKFPSKGTNLNVSKTKTHNKDTVLPGTWQTISKKLRKDLSSKSSINFNSGFHGKSKEQLIVFLNSKGRLPEINESKIDDLSKGNSLSHLMKFVGLPENIDGKLQIIQIAAKIGLSAALWGNPIVGIVSSVVLSSTFSQLRDYEQNSGSQDRKKEDRIFSDIYKYSPYYEENKLSPNNLMTSIKEIYETNIAMVDLQNSITPGCNLQYSLKQLEARFAYVSPKHAFRE